MRRLFGWILLLASAAPASDSAKPKVNLEEPAGMIYADGNLYVADRGQGLIAVRPKGSKEFYEFAKSEEFRKPSGLAYGQDSLYVADPGAGALFKVDLAGKVTRVKGSESFKTPSEVVFWE